MDKRRTQHSPKPSNLYWRVSKVSSFNSSLCQQSIMRLFNGREQPGALVSHFKFDVEPERLPYLRWAAGETFKVQINFNTKLHRSYLDKEVGQQWPTQSEILRNFMRPTSIRIGTDDGIDTNGLTQKILIAECMANSVTSKIVQFMMKQKSLWVLYPFSSLCPSL